MSLSPVFSRRAWWCTRPIATQRGQWLAPSEVRVEADGEGRRAFLLEGDEPVEIGPIEKMSKSKRNTVDPDEIIATYGADTARWFMLSDSPPGARRDLDGGGRPGRLQADAAAMAPDLRHRPRRRRGASGAAGGIPAMKRGAFAASPMRRSPRSRTISSGCASMSASRRSTSSPTSSARRWEQSRRRRSPTICACLRRGRRHPRPLLCADDAPPCRRMLGSARPQDVRRAEPVAGRRPQPDPVAPT